jgi:aspartate racemase
MTAPNIVLTGFMGTGKSTVGRLLAAQLGRDFVDTDAIIEERHGPIPEIFEARGEPTFRAMEHGVATELATRTGLVIATGGGMLIDPATAEILGGRVFCLSAPADELVRRVRPGAPGRPLLQTSDPAARIAELLRERAGAYSRFEPVDTSDLGPGEVADAIAARLEPSRMRTIGLLGGMSWESSAEYYRIINQETRRRLGGTHSAKSVMYSVDFHEIEALQEAGDWETATALMVEAARRLEAGGADLVVICTNTMHKMADEVAAAIDIPILHIADATAAAISAAGVTRVALLGTRYTMEADFYRDRLEEMHRLEVMIPEEPARTAIHEVIYDELVQGVISDVSRRRLLEAIGDLVARGAEGVIAGCTEIELLVTADHVSVPYFPTTRLHALAAVTASLRPVGG